MWSIVMMMPAWAVWIVWVVTFPLDLIEGWRQLLPSEQAATLALLFVCGGVLALTMTDVVNGVVVP